MSLLRPDARVRGIAAAIHAGDPPPEDPLNLSIYVALGGVAEFEPDPDVRDALDIYQSSYHHVLDAVLLAGAPHEEICSAFGLAPGVLDAYTQACFHMGAFRHVFAIRHYITKLEDDGTEEFKSYTLAISEGYDSVLDRYRISDWPDLDPKKATMRLAREFVLRSREHRRLPLTSAVAKESLKVAKYALEACAQLQGMIAEPKKGGAGSLEELKMALLKEDHTIPPDSTVVVLTELVRTGPADSPAKPT